MPVYEYKCESCGVGFELLVMGSAVRIECPGCGSVQVQKKFSVFGMSGVERPFAGGSSSNCSGCSKTGCSSCG